MFTNMTQSETEALDFFLQTVAVTLEGLERYLVYANSQSPRSITDTPNG